MAAHARSASRGSVVPAAENRPGVRVGGVPLPGAPRRVHEFTAYPPGFAPYFRQPMLAVGPAGEEVRAVSGAGLGRALDAATYTVSACSDLREFKGTVFEAACRRQPEESREPDDFAGSSTPSPASGGRHGSGRSGGSSFAARVVGVAADLADEVRLRIAHVLRVPVTDLASHSQDQQASGSRAAAIQTTLRRIPRSTRLAFDLLVCAWQVGRIGRPLW